MLNRLRPAIEPFKGWLAAPFVKLGLGPGEVGLLGIVFAAAAAGAARAGFLSASFWLAGLALLTDMADGEVARRTGRQTPEGNYLDAVGDRVCECLLLFGLLPHAPNLVAASIAGACLVSFAKARCALVRVIDNRDWPGSGDYPDRGVLIAVAYLMQPNPSLPLLMLCGLTAVALIRRVHHAKRLIQEASREELLPYLRPRISDEYQR